MRIMEDMLNCISDGNRITPDVWHIGEGRQDMAGSLDRISFRDLYQKYILVKDIDRRTLLTIKAGGFHVREDDNAALLYGYIDHEAGLSFEVVSAACIFPDGAVALEPANPQTSMKLRYGSFSGEVQSYSFEDFEDPFLLKQEIIGSGYKADPGVEQLRGMKELDDSRAPGYPDDILVYFIREGLRNEGIWCRSEGVDMESRTVRMKMLNEPMGSFGKHIGDEVGVRLYTMTDGSVKAVAVLD